ncbi:hypothetical protein [Salibacterium aidingense]|uniref:hypothetical protein n=1 Tax=Salibacterium aidingense TaxID=384933 RepID=UPI003BDF0684
MGYVIAASVFMAIIFLIWTKINYFASRELRREYDRLHEIEEEFRSIKCATVYLTDGNVDVLKDAKQFSRNNRDHVIEDKDEMPIAVYDRHCVERIIFDRKSEGEAE